MDMMEAKPLFSSPSMAWAGTRASSKVSSACSAHHQPCLRSMAMRENPGASEGTRNRLTPWIPAPPVRAATTKWSDFMPPVI